VKKVGKKKKKEREKEEAIAGRHGDMKQTTDRCLGSRIGPAAFLKHRQVWAVDEYESFSRGLITGSKAYGYYWVLLGTLVNHSLYSILVVMNETLGGPMKKPIGARQ